MGYDECVADKDRDDGICSGSECFAHIGTL